VWLTPLCNCFLSRCFRINKWLSEIVLLEQQFVVGGEDSSKPPTVAAVLAAEGAKLGPGTTVSVKAFQRFLVGEGVQSNKNPDSFAKEVAEKLAKAQ
jgi:translation elongation factor EF-Ts